MRKMFYSAPYTGTVGHASRSFSLLETMHMKSEELDGKTESESGIWIWRVHEIALHEASHGEGPLKFDRRELLLKQLSDEVTRKVQEKLSIAHST